jgi:hypothetical protein
MAIWLTANNLTVAAAGERSRHDGFVIDESIKRHPCYDGFVVDESMKRHPCYDGFCGQLCATAVHTNSSSAKPILVRRCEADAALKYSSLAPPRNVAHSRNHRTTINLVLNYCTESTVISSRCRYDIGLGFSQGDNYEAFQRSTEDLGRCDTNHEGVRILCQVRDQLPIS